MEARGGRREGATSRLFPLPIVHLALSIFKSLPFLMDSQREPLQRSELQYSFLLFFLIAYLLILQFFLFFKHMLPRYFSQLKSLKDISLRGNGKKGEGERSANGTLILSPQPPSLLILLCKLKDIVLCYICWRSPSERIFFSFFCKRTRDNVYKQA